MVEEREERQTFEARVRDFVFCRERRFRDDETEKVRARFSAQQLTVIFVPHHAPRGACGVRVRRKVTPMTWNVSFRIRNEARRRASDFQTSVGYTSDR